MRLYPIDNRFDSQLDSCTFIPPSDITAIPQQYMIQMTTSIFPPSRLASFIDCPNCDSSSNNFIIPCSPTHLNLCNALMECTSH